MYKETSCGAVVYTKINGTIKYVIIESKEGFFGFPKGHMEGTETEKETALREIAEETGLSVVLVDGFQMEDMHPFTKNGETRMKHVVYFLAEYRDQVPVPQEAELRSIHLMEYEEALTVFQFERIKQILREAQTFLTQ